jgi:hypothetical protein
MECTTIVRPAKYWVQSKAVVLNSKNTVIVQACDTIAISFLIATWAGFSHEVCFITSRRSFILSARQYCKTDLPIAACTCIFTECLRSLRQTFLPTRIFSLTQFNN